MHMQPGVFAIYTGVIDTAPHQHHQIQITLPQVSCVLEDVDGTLNCAHIIPSNHTHQLKMEAGWIILVEPHSDLGQQLYQRYSSTQVSPLHNLPTLDHNASMAALLARLGIENGLGHTALDPRIAQLVTQLDNSLKNAIQLEPTYWRASKVAAQMHLSESRFLHLFRAHMGIAWRPYLMWRRLICAIGYLQQQQSITMAATYAGFSDSAHFSRSFKKQFGLNPKTALKQVKR
ncbi:helix-turn-helix transcriptional regulator [Pseudoalteromonas sp. SMS1]|uniref:helix-turn-helix transcriptional regulator n=1 Tax=Pseudoalteromonas sp. SMS1 TaxID=2908894 RepID=UPI001F1E0EEF|nr:helix-turn-helix transcriptional regulator [Pseudoalteromonas sp. SMS1]MCF2857536.1 helix-turn-helix transcriptional regulator [Pseudoalteromonas sp. SMS1]